MNVISVEIHPRATKNITLLYFHPWMAAIWLPIRFLSLVSSIETPVLTHLFDGKKYEINIRAFCVIIFDYLNLWIVSEPETVPL